jgi:2-aminobenzoate-CoA ligase
MRTGHVDTFAADNLPPFAEWPELIGLDSYGYPERLNASVELLEGTITRHGADRPAIIGADSSWSYGEVHDLVSRAANVLVDAGVQPGNRVLLRGPNNPWLAISWLAVLRVGGVVVTTMPMLRAGELEKVVQIAQVQFAIVDHRYLEEWEAAAGFDGITIAYGGDSDDDLTARCAAASSLNVPCDTHAEDVALLAFTSGTTGGPKSTMHFHRDILLNVVSKLHDVYLVRNQWVFAGSVALEEDLFDCFFA